MVGRASAGVRGVAGAAAAAGLAAGLIVSFRAVVVSHAANASVRKAAKSRWRFPRTEDFRIVILALPERCFGKR
jgi:hypothetical protein